jgi:hypothetical protein
MNITQKDTLIKNCFFLWSQAVILLLSGIPVISQIVSELSGAPVWVVPKAYELKIYAVTMMVCFAMPFLCRYAPSLLLKDHPRYKLFFLLFYPCAVLIYSLALPDFMRCASVFILALTGVALLVYDMRCTIGLQDSYCSRHYNELLLTSVSLTILLIICQSNANVFNFFSITALGMFLVVFAILRFANFQTKYFACLVPIFIFLVAFGSMQGAIEVTHYSFFLGPITEVLYGHFHPLAVNAQYGSGLTAFLALYFKAKGAVSFVGLQELLKYLQFVQYLLIYLIATVLYRSQKIAFLTLLAILLFNFFAPNVKYYYCNPSSGFLRFGFIYLILACYLLENKIVSSRTVNFMTSILGSVAFLWSFESAVYTLPALFFAEYMAKDLRKFLPIFLSCFGVVILLYLSPFLLEGHWPPVWRYYEYAMVYVHGFGQISLNRLTSFWWLLPLLYGFLLIKIMTGDISNKLVSALTVYGMAIFTYFAGRSHPINIFVISIPFILLSVYCILDLKSPSSLVKEALLALALVVFPSAYYVIGSNSMVIQGVWDINVPLVKNFLLIGPAPPFLISDSGSPWWDKAYDDNVAPDCAKYAPLNKYLKNKAIAILSTDNKNLTNFYACTQSHNALSVNPYYETAINSKAVARAVKQASTLESHYLLVESNLLKSPRDPWESEMTPAILQQLHAKKVGEFQLADQAITLFQI